MKTIKLAIILGIITFMSTTLFSQSTWEELWKTKEVKVGEREFFIMYMGAENILFSTKENKKLQHNVSWYEKPTHDKKKTAKLADILREVVSAKGKKLTVSTIAFRLIVDTSGKIIDLELSLEADCVDHSKISDKVCFTIEDFIELERRVKSEINLGPFNDMPEHLKGKYFWYNLTSVKESTYE